VFRLRCRRLFLPRVVQRVQRESQKRNTGHSRTFFFLEAGFGHFISKRKALPEDRGTIHPVGEATEDGTGDGLLRDFWVAVAFRWSGFGLVGLQCIVKGMTRMKTALLAALAILGSSCLFAQATAAPVPAKWLRDGKLFVEDLAFSIDTPNPDFKWTFARQPDVQGKKAVAFLVDASADSKFLVLVWDQAGGFGSSGETKQFIDGMRKTMKNWSVDDVKLEPSAFPLKDSMRLTMTLHSNADSSVTLHEYGYVISGSQHIYMLQVYSQESTEPPQFAHFAGSFTLLPSQKAGSDWTFYAFMGVMVLVVQVIPIWISVKAKPIGEKPYRWGTYVGIITGFVGASFVLTLWSASDIYGRESGVALCASAILCSVGILRRRKYGVIMFVTTYLLLMMSVPFMTAMRHESVSPQQQGQDLPVLVFLGLTIGYFVKRWRLMGKAAVHGIVITPLPVPPMPPPIPPTQLVERPLQREGTVAPTTPDLSAQLQRLGEMHSNGLLTDDEFRLAKARLIG
jgi:hypothetical protein